MNLTSPKKHLLHLLFTSLFHITSFAQPAAQSLPDLTEWNGVLIETEATGSFLLPGGLSYAYPDGEKGWHRNGMNTAHDGSGDWYDLDGLRFDLYLPSETPLKAEVILKIAPRRVNGGSQ